MCLYGEDLESLKGFYQRLLGTPPFSESPGRHVFFRLSDAVLLLFNPKRTLKSVDVPPHGCSGPSHIAFYVEEEEYESWKEKVRGMGVEIEAEVVWPSGGRSFYFRDPAGNSLEITTPKTWRV